MASDPHLQFHDHLLNAVGQAVIATDLAGAITYWNRAAETLYGWRADEVIGRNVVEVVPSETTQAQAHEIMARLATGQSWSGEFLVRRRDGVSFLAHVTDTPIYDDDGRLVGVAGISSDVTHLRRAEQALRESQDRVRQALSAARMYTFEWDPATDQVYRSEECATILGSLAEDITGQYFLQHVHPDDREPYFAALTGLWPDHDTYRSSFRLRRPDGEALVIEEVGRGVFTSEGRLERVYGVTADVTERVRIEEALRASEAQASERLAEIEAVYAGAPIGLCVLDRDLRFLRLNDRLAEINGVPAADHLGRTLHEVLPDLAPTAAPLLQQVIDTGQPIIGIELEGVTPAQPGVTRTWVEHWYPLRAADGAVLGINIVAEEVTERKRAEAERARLYLAERAARGEAEAALHVRDTFISIASHELRTPLTALLGNAQLLQRKLAVGQPLTERQMQAVQTVVEQARRLNELVTRVLDVSRLQSGRFGVQPEPLDLVDLVRRVVAAEELALEPGHCVETSVDGEPLVVDGDALRLEQVFHNLVQNAVKYSPQGGVVRVEVGRQDDMARVVVRDQGIGIPAAEVKHLFQRFYRGDHARSRQIGGMGIGLYVVKEIVMQHGGAVDVASHEGDGSAFTVYLPLRDGA